jgi:quinol monooxygenase YgiN
MQVFSLRMLSAALLLTASSFVSSYAAEPVIVVVKVFPSPGRADELQAQYIKRAEYLRKEEPGATFRVHRSRKNPTTFLWDEVYPSQDAYEHHLKVVLPNFKKEFGQTPAGVLAKPSESNTYTEFAK